MVDALSNRRQAVAASSARLMRDLTQTAGVHFALPTLQRNATVSSSEIIYADEVAALLRRSLDTIRYWDRVGNVLPPSHKLGRRKYWRRSEIESLITK